MRIGKLSYDEENSELILRGEFDCSNEEQMDAVLRSICLSLDKPEVRVDLTQVTYLQSCTTLPLVKFGIKTAKNGINAVFTIPDKGVVKRIYDIVGLARHFNVVEVPA
jgi:anti-anti-sigma factor